MVMKCPKCGGERHQGDAECSSCGIIYAKYENVSQKKITEYIPPMADDNPKPNQPSSIQIPAIKISTPSIVFGIIVLLVVSFIWYKNSVDKKFSAFILSTTGKMITLANNTDNVVDEMNRAWHDAIFSTYDKKDFNEAIANVALNRAESISAIKKLTDEISDDIKKMRPPSDREKDYQRLKEIYLLINKYANMATAPTGTLQSYSSQHDELSSEIRGVSKELEMMR